MLKRIITVGMVLVFGVVLVPQGAWGAVPSMMSFQGRISDVSGPLANQSVPEIVFEIRTANTFNGGTLKWRSVPYTVQTNGNGVFDVVLSEGGVGYDLLGESMDVFDGTVYLHVYRDESWLGAQPLTTVPYAFRAKVADSLAEGAAGTSPWSVSLENIYYNEGWVGIGTNSPKNRLHIHQPTVSGPEPVPMSPYIRITNQSTGSLASDGATIGLNDQSHLVLKNFESKKSILLQTDGGNVGIGTTSPSATLHVAGHLMLEPQSAAPTGPLAGKLYYDSVKKKPFYYNGEGWIPMGTIAATKYYKSDTIITSAADDDDYLPTTPTALPETSPGEPILIIGMGGGKVSWPGGGAISLVTKDGAETNTSTIGYSDNSWSSSPYQYNQNRQFYHSFSVPLYHDGSSNVEVYRTGAARAKQLYINYVKVSEL